MYFTKLIEFEHIGFNPIFIFALCTIFFSIMEAWGFYNQNKVIWRKKKGDSITVDTPKGEVVYKIINIE